MTAQALVIECQNRGLSLRVDGRELVIQGPLDTDLKDRLRQHKTELLALLNPRCDRHGPIEPCYCGCCSFYREPGGSDWHCRECHPVKLAAGFVLMVVPG